MNIFRLNPVDLFRLHSCYKHQHGYVAKYWCSRGQILRLFIEREDTSLFVVLLQRFCASLAHRIFDWHLGLDRVIEDGAKGSQFTVDGCRLNRLIRGLPLPAFPAYSLELAQACRLVAFDFVRRNAVQRGIREEAQQSDAADLVTPECGRLG